MFSFDLWLEDEVDKVEWGENEFDTCDNGDESSGEDEQSDGEGGEVNGDFIIAIDDRIDVANFLFPASTRCKLSL